MRNKPSFTAVQQVERLEKALMAPSTDFQYVQSLVRIIKQDSIASANEIARLKRLKSGGVK